MVNRQEAKEMRDALTELQNFEAQQEQERENQLMAQALVWYNTIKQNTPTDRQEALDDFNFIKSKIQTESDNYRKRILQIKLQEANEKFKELKKHGD